MWPHHIKIGVGDTALSVASDDEQIIERLLPWRIGPADDLIDYTVRLHPVPADDPAAPKVMPSLSRGSLSLARSPDPDRVAESLFELLGEFANPPGPGQIRLRMTAAIRNGTAVLFPAVMSRELSDRRMAQLGIDVRLGGRATRVDTELMAVVTDPPLGSAEKGDVVPIREWWIPTRNAEAGITVAEAVAYSVRYVDGMDEDNANAALAAVAKLVSTKAPGFAPEDRSEFPTRLDSALA